MTVPASEDLSFRYTAVDRAGRQVRDVVRARDARAAARSLAAEGLTPTSITEEKRLIASSRNRDLKFAERVLVLRQIALMVEAGVGLLEALQTVAGGITARRGQIALEQTIAALKRGESFATALEANAPGYPFYVYAMARVGEATGHVSEVLNEAADLMAYEHKLRREFTGSLTYPAFLVVVGTAAVLFMLTFVVPRFAEISANNPDSVPAFSKAVFAVAVATRDNLQFVLFGGGAIIVLIALGLTNKPVRARLLDGLYGMPVIKGLWRARQITSWARLLGFSLSNGVLLLEAAALARRGTPEGPFKKSLEHFDRDLKAGVEVDVSLARHTSLEAMDLSLLRAGQKSGKLARMFIYVAERYDQVLRDRLNRITALVGPVTIIFIAVLVLICAIAIVLSMMSVYETIG